MYHLRKLKSLLLLLLVAVTAKAQISEGNVYNFVNVGNNTQSMVIASNNFVSIAATNTSDYDQLWYVSKNSDNSYSLRNLGSGRYLRSSNAASVKWTMVKEEDVDDNCKFSCTAAGSGYTLRATNTTNGGHYMHYGANNGGVVGWSTDAVATQWTIQEVGVGSDVLTDNWNELASIDPSASTVTTYQGYLETLFSDKACTTLNSEYASMNESTLKNQTAYKNLPAALQQMVLKVRNNSWAESNYDENKSSWSAEYAQKYRVQLYEPYNEPEAAASALGINAHTNLNNPTGIFANDREALYVMVEGTIKEGASLYLASYRGNGEPVGYADGVELKPGLNVVPSFGDGNNYVINYVVHTFDTSDGKKGNAAKAYCLSAFDDLKIHIEGGYINGYWNKMGDDLYTPDTRTNWDYIEARATQTTVTILGEYITLQFPLRDKDAVEDDGTQQKGLAYYLNQVDVRNVIDEWDNIMMWERFLLGLAPKEVTTDPNKNVKSPYSASNHVVEYTGNDGDTFATDYSDYYNVHGLSLGVGYNYMFGGWRYCGYNYNTMQSIIIDMLTSAGSHWGPGHEIGHQHQGLLNLNGLTEVSNNLFSNVVLWYFGESTSRVNGDEGSLSNVLAAYNTEGSDFYTNNIWAQTHLYYKLFLYYHVLGHNPKFYPRLFEMLRQEPMKNGSQIDGATSLLHFYKKCCLAAGEDLTEFFRAYGFFRVMTDRLVGDYSNATYNMTQAQIDAAIAEVKAFKYKENVAVLFINDATGETIKSHKGDNLALYGETTVCAEVGGYASFNANTTPNYTYTVSGTTVTMTGEGGTGFAIFNEKGELIAFSDKKTFTISDECAVALASGKAEVKSVQADNTIVETTDVMDTGNTDAKYAALGELLTAAADLLAFSDADNSKPGFYKASVMQTLQQLYTEAQSVYNNKEVNSYATAYAALYQEYIHIATLETDKTPFLPGSTYVLTNKKYPTTAMTLSDNGMMCVYNSSSSAQQWTFEATDEKDIYYLKNGNNYLGSLLQSTQVGVTAKETASRYKLFDLGKGLWALQCQNDSEELQSLHCNTSYKIVGWSHTSTDNDGSWWYLTATAKDESMLPLYDLQNLIAKTEALVDEMATVQGKGTAVELSEENVSSNTPESGHEAKYLVDGKTSTFFHTNWKGDAVSEYHNIVIDLGEQHSLAEFVLNYMTLPTSAYNVDAPKSMIVSGSNDGSSYSTITTLSGLPTDKGAEYTSNTLGNGNASQAYRYIRLQVTDATGGSLGGYKYFGLAELNLIRMSTFVEAIDDKYSNFISAAEVATICDQLYTAQQTYASGSATTDDVAALQAQYDILLEAYENANNEEFNAKKQELLDLISSTNSLIKTCGTVTLGENRTLTLSTSSGVGDARLTQWSSGASEGSLENLYDGKVGTYYVSNWNAVNAAPYLQVYFNDGVGVDKFTFTFTGRKDGNAPTPTTIVVSGSNNGSTFTEIETFSKDGTWPVAANNQTITPKTWTSPTITSATTYKYLRFTVTAAERSSGNVNNYYGYCHYGISEFGVNRVVETSVTLSGNHGDATEDLLLDTYHAANAAQEVCDRATTEAQLQSAINNLAVAKEALYNAMYPNVEYTITANIPGGGVTFDDGEPCVGGGTLTVPASLTPDELKAKLAAIELSGYVAQSITINENVITVIYNKEYTVNINGGEGNGRVTFNGMVYANEGTFNALQGSFTEADLTANDVEGYTKSAVTVDHETGIISVTYTLDRTALESLIGDTNELMQACQGFVNSAYVTEQLLINTSNAIGVAQTKLESDLTYAEYTAAVYALRTAYDTLEEAKAEAEVEAEGREAQRTVLNTLMGTTNNLIEDCVGYPGDVTAGLLDEVRAAVASAKTVADNMGSTEEQLTNATTALQIKYDVLYAAKNSTAKADLRALIVQTTALIEECGVVVNGRHPVATTPVALQTTDENAAYYLSTNAQQSGEGPIANLLDGSTGSYFHSNWSSQVGEAHRLQVDMGDGHTLKEFAFSYTTRDNGTGGPHPSTIVVSGSNSFDETFVELATINSGLPTTGNTAWNTANENVITASEAYRYLRFTVTASAGTNGCKHGNNEYFFAMSEFSLSPIIYETSYFVELMLSYGNVTEEQLINVAKARDDAEALAEESYNKVALVEATANLQALYNTLQDAHNDYSYLPVTLTTKMESPVLYTLGSGRGNNKVLQYDPAANHMLSIADASENSRAKQLFYFTKGSVKGQVFIHPFAAGENILASNDVTDGSAKVKVMPKYSEGYMQEWTLPVQNAANSVYNIKPITGGTYFSNHSGDGYKMGFYNSTGDDGSRFTFTQTTIEGSSAYHSLKVYYDEVTVKDFTNSNPGNYRKSPEIEAACNDADELLRVPSGDYYATYLEAYRDLRAANESLEIIVPEGGKFYTIKNGDYYITGNTTSGDRIELSTANDANTIYYYDGTHLLSYSTGLYIGLNANDWTFEAVGSNDISTVEFSVSTTTAGAFNINCGSRWLHKDNGFVNRCDNNNAHGTEHSWIIEEVTSLPVSVNVNLGFASFYAPVALRIPEGMTAYVVTELDGDKAPIEVLAEENEVIPANTGVLLAADGGDYTLAIADDNDAEEVEGTNLLGGTIDDQYIEYGNNIHYMLGYKNSLAGLYQVSKNLTSTGTKDEANGTHFKNNGFKSYLTVPGSAGVVALRIYRGTSTEIEKSEIDNQESEMIYDLMGRRVEKMVKGNMYIVNGCKLIF